MKILEAPREYSGVDVKSCSSSVCIQTSGQVTLLQMLVRGCSQDAHKIVSEWYYASQLEICLRKIRLIVVEVDICIFCTFCGSAK